MDVYILKFTACLAIFVVFYKLFLENQNMHRFKRYYLLASLVFAFSVPFITFTEYVEPVQPIESFQTSFEPVFVPQIIEEPQPQINYLPIVLWSIYGLGVLLFLTKFILNLSRIFNRIRKNETHQSQSFIYVLLNDLVIPHSFFSYIFLNKQGYKSEQIPNEVLIHEQTHAKQKHSLDVLAIELLQMVFWFHPLIYVLKHAIKLNHEFLADEAVINHGVKPSAYQQLLIAFSSNASKQVPTEIGMASAINYSSIKKRFTVMNTNTSKRNIWLRSIVLLPLIAFSIYGFSDRKEVMKPLEDLQISHSNYTARSISIEILENGTYTIDGVTANKSTLITEVNKLHQDITAEIRNDIMNIHVTSSSKISNEETWFLYNSLLDYGFYRLVTPEQEVVKGKGNTPFAIEQTQHKATPEEIKEYNKLASQQNDKPLKLRIFKQKDVERMEYLYKKMSQDQKANAEPFPNFPPPPSPETGFIEVNGETLFVIHYSPKRYYNKKGYLVDKNGKTLNGNTQVNASDVLPGHYITKVYQNDEVVAEFKDNMPNQKNMKVIKGGEWSDVESYLNPDKSTKTSSQDSIPVLDFQQNPLKLSLNGKLTSMETLKADFIKITKNKASDLRINAKGEVQMSFIKQIKAELGVELVKIYLDQSAHILDDTISIETQITVFEEKTSELVKINGKSPINNIINLSKKEIEKAIITIDNGEIVKFNFKIPSKPSESISGNALNSKAKSYLISAEIGDQIQLFMIKNSKNQVHPPILITIVE